MSDLISRSALLQEFEREIERNKDSFFDGTLFHYTGIKAFIENAPTVEAIPKEKVLEIVEKLEELASKRWLVLAERCGYQTALDMLKGVMNERD